MTIKLFGSEIQDPAKAISVGSCVSIVHVVGLLLVSWILYKLCNNGQSRKPYKSMFYAILGGTTSVMWFGVDTQIALFIPSDTPIWTSIITFIGFSFILVFIVTPLLGVIDNTTVGPLGVRKESCTFVKTNAKIFGLSYMILGFVLVLLCTVLTDSDNSLRGASLAFFLLGVFVVWIAYPGAIHGSKHYTFPVILIVGFMILMLSIYASFYFIQDLYARCVELTMELLLLVLMWLYAYVALIRSTDKEEEDPYPNVTERMYL